MSTLANESLFETFYEEALEELDVKNDGKVIEHVGIEQK